MQAPPVLRSGAVAIYHFDLSSLSRAAGQSAVRAWAYISGTRQTDARTGRIADYSRKAGEVLAVGTAGPADWQAAEAAERRKDAKVGRSIILALPCELGLLAQRALVDGFGAWLRLQHGIAVGWAIHAPPGDARNTHAHLLLTTRTVDEAGVQGAKVRDLDRSATSAVIVKNWRARWEQSVNLALAERGEVVRVDARSHRAAGRQREAQEHLGPHRAAQARKGYGVLAVVRNATAISLNRLRVELSDLARQIHALQRAAKARAGQLLTTFTRHRLQMSASPRAGRANTAHRNSQAP